MRTWLLLLLVIAPAVTPTAAADDPWWDQRWHFRMRLSLPAEGIEPMTGAPVQLDGMTDPLVLVPVDFTQALLGTGDWPFDAAGRPRGWTFAPDTVRVRDVASGEPVPARFLPYHLGLEAASAYDPQANAAGALALLVPGRLSEARRLDVYFDIEENGPKPPEAATARQLARLDEVGGLGPFASTLAWVPPATPGAKTSLLLLGAGDGEAEVLLERVAPGAAPERIGLARVGLQARVDLPSAERGYDLRIVATRPILAILEITGPASARASFFHAALDGTAAGTRFLLPSGSTVDLIGTSARTRIEVADAHTGARLGTYDVGRLATALHSVPPGGVHRVTSTQPILALERGGTEGAVDGFLHQARDLSGAPGGTVLVASRGAGHALLADAPATVRAFPLARPQEVATARAGEPGREAWISRASASAAEPWAFSTDAARLSALVGSDGLAVIAGPEGRRFDVAVAATRRPDDAAAASLSGRLYTPLPETTLTLVARSLNGTTLSTASTTLSAGASTGTFPDGSREIAAEGTMQSIRSDKPAFFYVARPGASAKAVLPGLPPLVPPAASSLEFFGPVLVWSEASTQVVARPGETARAGLTLANLGRAVGGEPLAETVSLSLGALAGARCAADWEATLPGATLDGFLAPSERGVEVYVTVPETAQAGACLELELTATSGIDSRVRAVARVTVKALSGFQPELRVLRADGTASPAASVMLEPGVAGGALLRLRNLGGEPGEAILAHSSGPGYATSLRRDDSGEEAARLAVGANETILLRFEARAPTGTEPAWDFRVQATSARDPTARDEVVIRTVVRPNVSLAAKADDPRLLVTPRGNASTTVRLENLGGDVEIRPRVASGLPAGWTASVAPERILVRATGSRGDDGERLDAVSFNVTVSAPAGAVVGESVPFAVSLEGAGSSTLVPLSALVVNDFRITAHGPSAVAAAPGDSGVLPLTLRSDASGSFGVTVRSVVPPRGWQVEEAPKMLALAPGAESRITLRYDVLPLAPAGPGAIRIVLRLEDGVSPPVEREELVRVTTLEQASLRLEVSDRRLVLAEGERAPLVVTLRNEGNAPASLPIEATGPVEHQGDVVQLAPGATHVAELMVGPGEGLVRISAADAKAEVEVVRATRDVRVADARVRSLASGGHALDLRVENVGSTPAPGVMVTLRDGQGIVARFLVAALPPGASATHTLLAPATAGQLTIEAQGSDGARDATPGDNVRVVEPPGPATHDARAQSRAIPTPAALVLLSLAICALARWRR